MEVKVVYQDKNLLIVDKPIGMVTTGEGGQKSLEDWVGENCPNDLPRRGIVHRLDKNTSGLVVIARDGAALKKLKADFKERRVVKKYLALAGGDLPFEGTIKMPISRSRYSFGKFAVNEEGKEARTEFRLKKIYQKNGKKYSLIEINLKTGRTHQIRVHFSYLKWPLVGDLTYGGEVVEGLRTQFLRAFYLKINQPETQKVVEVEVDLLPELKKVLEGLVDD